MQKVNVVLYSSFPEILSNIFGEVQFNFEGCPTNNKVYTFYSCPDCNGPLSAGDMVICQVQNTMTLGVVAEVLANVSREEFRKASLVRSKEAKNGCRLVIGRIWTYDLLTQLEFKHKYEAAVRELETTTPINEIAFKMALDRL